MVRLLRTKIAISALAFLVFQSHYGAIATKPSPFAQWPFSPGAERRQLHPQKAWRT